MKFSNRLTRSLSLLSAGVLVSFGVFQVPAMADDIVNPRQSLPGRRVSGGVRDSRVVSCFADFDQSIVSVMPRLNLGTTAEARPTFWFSVPETTENKSVEFQLINSAEEVVYATQIAMGNKSGLSEFRLPETATELAVNEDYKWTLSLSCHNGAQSPVLGLQGWVRRVEITPELAHQIDSATATERVELYRAAGLWQEQVTALLNLRRNDEANIDHQLAWAALIQPTGLASELANDLSHSMRAIETTALSDGLAGSAQ